MFLWFDVNLGRIITYRMIVYLFGATSSPGEATSGLRKLAKDHSGLSSAAAKSLSNFCVDDEIKSVDSIMDVRQLVKDAREVCGKGDIPLHKFVSNIPEVLEQPHTQKYQSRPTCLRMLHPLNELLVSPWCVKIDTLKFTSDLQPKLMTRRRILSTIAQVYDSIGLASPFPLK